MKDQVRLDEENQLSRQKLPDDANLTEAPEYFVGIEKLIAKLPRRYAILDSADVDARKILCREAREYVVTCSTPDNFEETAYINVAPSLRIIAKVIKKIAVGKFNDQGKTAFFKHENSTVNCLNRGTVR